MRVRHSTQFCSALGRSNYMPMVMSSQSPLEMWNALCQFFKRKTVSNKVYTLMQLYGLHMKKGTCISEYLRMLDGLSV